MVKEGDKAPAFSLMDANEKTVELSDFKGDWLVLYFYPKDNTPGCTIEANEFTGLKGEFEKLGCVILGISKDSCKSHQKFIESQHLNIHLLSDPDSKMQKDYGVWRPKKFMGREFLGTVRSTFLLDPDGVVRKVWDNVKARGHAEVVLGELKRLMK